MFILTFLILLMQAYSWTATDIACDIHWVCKPYIHALDAVPSKISSITSNWLTMLSQSGSRLWRACTFDSITRCSPNMKSSEFIFLLLPQVFDSYDNTSHLWTYVSHFHNVPFYVYSYAFADLVVGSLYGVYQNSSDGFEEKLLDLLRAGGTKDFTDALSPFGLNPAEVRWLWCVVNAGYLPCMACSTNILRSSCGIAHLAYAIIAFHQHAGMVYFQFDG